MTLRALGLSAALLFLFACVALDADGCIRFKKPAGTTPPALREPPDPPPPQDSSEAPLVGNYKPGGAVDPGLRAPEDAAPESEGPPRPPPDTTDRPSPDTTPSMPIPVSGTGVNGPTTPGGGTSPRKQAGEDESAWEVWWELNRIDFFPRRYVVAVTTSGDGTPVRAGPSALRASVVEARLWPLLAKAVDDKQAFVQEAALITMGRVAANESQRARAREILLAKLAHRNHLVARAAALGLFHVADEASIFPMYECAMDARTPEDVRAFLALTMASLEHPMAAQLLKDLADASDGYYELVGAAIVGLGFVGGDNGAHVAPFLEGLAFGKRKTRAKYRALAVESLGRLGSLELAREPLLRALDDRAVDVRRSAALALGVLDYRTEAERQIEGILERYAAYLGVEPSVHDNARLGILRARIRKQRLALAGEVKPVVKRLVKTMNADTDAFTRRMAAISLGRIAAQSEHGVVGTRHLERQVERGRLGMREFAMLALAIAGDPSAVEHALEAVDRRNPSTRGAACIALGLAADKDRATQACGADRRRLVGDRLSRVLLEDVHPHVRGYASLALGIIGDAGSARLIQHTIDTTRTPETRAYGLLGLALLGTRQGADNVVRLVRSGEMRDGFVASHAVYALGLTKDRRGSTFDTLIEAASGGGDMYVRAASIAALGYLSSAEFYPRRHLMATGYNYRIGYDFIETYFYKL